jgi:rhodanese-related sulfurtransferase
MINSKYNCYFLGGYVKMRRVSVAIAFLAGVLAHGLSYSHTNLTPSEVKAWLDTGDTVIVLDVREESEFCDSNYSPPGHIPGAINMPWNSGYLQAHYSELPPDEDIIVVCRSGNRSNTAANFLDGQGFTSVFDMTGGMNAWLWETENCPVASVPSLEDRVTSAPVLGPASPNPFSTSTEISYALPHAEGPSRVTLSVYDARGRLVTTIVDNAAGASTARAAWDGMDDRGRPVTSGLYFYRFTANGWSLTRRVVLLR